jgi:hypothetical protein
VKLWQYSIPQQPTLCGRYAVTFDSRKLSGREAHKQGRWRP